MLRPRKFALKIEQFFGHQARFFFGIQDFDHHNTLDLLGVARQRMPNCHVLLNNINLLLAIFKSDFRCLMLNSSSNFLLRVLRALRGKSILQVVLFFADAGRTCENDRKGVLLCQITTLERMGLMGVTGYISPIGLISPINSFNTNPRLRRKLAG